MTSRKRSISPSSSGSPRNRRIQFRDVEIYDQKSCYPGPRVQFPKRKRRFITYLNNILTPGSLGCHKNQYPKYENSGKYCCSDNRVTPQELLDYVNIMLEEAFDNTGPTYLQSQIPVIQYLISIRKQMLTYPEVVDSIQLPHPYTDVNVLLFDRWNESQELNKDPRDLPEDMELPPYQQMPFEQRKQMALERGREALATFGSPTRKQRKQTHPTKSRRRGS